MITTDILLILSLVLLIANILISLFKKPTINSSDLKSEMTKANLDISKIDPLIRSEFSQNREELQKKCERKS